MLLKKWIIPGETPLINGIRLAVINTFLSILFIATFIGGIEIELLLSKWMSMVCGVPRFYFPLNLNSLLLLYAVILFVVWMIFARRLKIHARRQLFKTALIGSMPLFILGLLGYTFVGWMLAFGDYNANQMLGTSVLVYGMISTLIFLAGITCVLLVTLVPKKR